VLQLESTLAQVWPCDRWSDITVLIAISGGADSMALLSALRRLKAPGPGRIIAAHYNHRLRGEASAGDAQFVQQTCQSLEVPLELGSAEEPLADFDPSRRTDAGTNPYAGLEAAARAARYEFLTATAARVGARYVATAHTADDQAETILQRILRGTGLAGLVGIPFTRRLSAASTVIRPLLTVSRTEVLAYLQAVGLGFREDASNEDQGFMRNRIRHELLPLLRERYHPAVNDSLLRLGLLAEEVRAVLQPQVDALLDLAVTFTPGGFTAHCAQLFNQPAHLVREVLMAAWRRQAWPEQDMGYAEWDGLARLVATESGEERRTLPGGIDVQREAGEVRFRQC
jgi:tRNA(Ile)-lysidine synthase